VFFNIIVILPVTTCGGLTRFVGPCHHAYWTVQLLKGLNISMKEVSFPVDIMLII
jgi:hypothetical protein